MQKKRKILVKRRKAGAIGVYEWVIVEIADVGPIEARYAYNEQDPEAFDTYENAIVVDATRENVLRASAECSMSDRDMLLRALDD